MKRYDDICELFESVENNIVQISEKYEAARGDENVSEILKPVVKSSFEHLRSVLEYTAQDIWASYTTKKNSPYFPFGKDESTFIKSANKNLPGLVTQRLDIYGLLESLQPHKSGDDWLPVLCSKTNFNKHNGLSKQLRKNSSSSKIVIGNARGSFSMEDSYGVMENCIVGGVPIGWGGGLALSNMMTKGYIESRVGPMVSVSKEFAWVEFVFDDALVDTRAFITHAKSMALDYVDKLKNII